MKILDTFDLTPGGGGIELYKIKFISKTPLYTVNMLSNVGKLELGVT